MSDNLAVAAVDDLSQPREIAARTFQDVAQSPAPIVSMVIYRERMFVATTDGVYELVGKQLKRLDLSMLQEPPKVVDPLIERPSMIPRGVKGWL